jgi:hypothetical protein
MTTQPTNDPSYQQVGVYAFDPTYAWRLIANLEAGYFASWERNMYEAFPNGSFFVMYSRLREYHMALQPKSTAAKMRHGWMVYQGGGGPVLSRDVQYRVDLQIAVENTASGVKITVLVDETIDPFHGRPEIQSGDYDPPSVLGEYRQMPQEIQAYLRSNG